MLIITLLDAKQKEPQQQWSFEKESVIKVGRLSSNEIILQAELVSGNHLEIQQIQPNQWQLISHGRNGTFVDGKRIEQITITDGLVVELAKGGVLLKFELQSAAVVTPSPPVTSAQQQTPVSPTSGQQQIQKLTLEKYQLELQLQQANQARVELENILKSFDAQFPPTFFSQREQEVTARLGEIQKLQTELLAEITRYQGKPEYEALLKVLSNQSNYLEQEQKSLKEFQVRMKQVKELLEKLKKHLQANQNLSQQLSTGGTRINVLCDDVTQQLAEFDKELGRIHEQHLLASAKQIFSL